MTEMLPWKKYTFPKELPYNTIHLEWKISNMIQWINDKILVPFIKLHLLYPVVGLQ